MKYKEYKQVNYAAIADDVQRFWDENQIFEKSVSSREGKETFTFYEGPPSANGTPGIHHVMARAVKDIFCRFKTLQGFQVKRKGGWDTHGLPVELQVEKELGITKEDIGKKISVQDYNQKCRESVMKFKEEWDELTKKMGYWVDLDNPYITFDKDYIETLWFLLKELHKKDFLYKGYTIQPYSPAAGTGLSSHELNQPGCYRDVKDTSIVAQFKLNGSQTVLDTEEDIFFLAWTTTPWTLPSNSALAVGAKITYVAIKTYNPYTFKPGIVILAKDLMEKFFSKKASGISFKEYKDGDKLIPWEVIKKIKGQELVGLSYEQLLPYVTPEGKAFEVILGDFVSTEDGTGIVHIAPTFGADDKRVADQAGISAITVKDEKDNELPLVDRQGRFIKEVTDFSLEPVKEAYMKEVPADYKNVDIRISIKLKQENKAFKVEKYEHSYPHCWRTDKPVLYYPMDSWFIRTTAVKDKLAKLNETINWKPASTGSGRFGNWLTNLVDWNLSRSRFWGTPLPIWRTEDGKEEICIGSVEELGHEIEKAKKAGFENPSEINDLHRPFVDEITLLSPTGRPMKRESDLIDVWFDSGAMPYAQWHYPFENKAIFDQNYPADFIAEGVDQTRGWFFTLHAISGMLFDSVAFKNVIANGLVLDKDGNKMSKRLGNAIDPFKTLAKYGPDATRWYMISNANPWDNLKFDLNGIQEVQRRFFATLQNTYSFFALYANLDGFSFEQAIIPINKRTESDRWVLSKLNSLIIAVENAYSEYEPTRAARAIQDFVSNDLSNWYVRLNRKRFWKGEYNEDKVAAYQTLYTCILTVAKISSPIAPFYMERLYQDLNEVTGQDKEVSIHIVEFPKPDTSIIDEELEVRMALSQEISSLVHSLRKKEMIKVRQPLSKILIPVNNPTLKNNISAVKELIKSEVNIKDIEFIEDDSDILIKRVKPNFPKLGKKYGSKMKSIASIVSNMSQTDINTLEKENNFDIDIEGDIISLTKEEVEINFQDIPGWLVASEGNITVALDVTLTNELRQEGLARDLVNRIQNMRKDMGLEVQDKINISVQKDNDLVERATIAFKDYICVETQASALSLEAVISDPVELEIDDLKVLVRIDK